MLSHWCTLLALATTPALPADSLARYVTTGPTDSLRVTVMGPVDGMPVVIIAGLVSPAYAFRLVLPPLAASGLRAVVVEPLGVGASSRPGGRTDYSIAAQAARVAAVMDTLGVRHAVVAGHAVGATIALRLALERPDLVGRVVLMEVGSMSSAAVPGVKQALRFGFLVRIFAGRGRIKKELRKGLIGSSVDSLWVTDSLIEHYTAGAAGNVGAVLRVLKRMDQSTEPDSLIPRFPEIQAPVRLIVGGGPRIDGGKSAGPGRIRNLRALPVFSVDTIFGSGVHMHEERPDAVIGVLQHEAAQNQP